jgi:hypothetical protein
MGLYISGLIVVTDLSTLTVTFSELHPSKRLPPKDVTEAGILIDVRDVQLPNASAPMLTSDEEGSNVTAVRPVCPANRLSDKSTTAAPIATDVIVAPTNKLAEG